MVNSYPVISKSFEELSSLELYAILALRVDVFCVEQDCPYQDLDGQDQQAQHVFIAIEHTIAAYARILKGEFKGYHIGRVVVHKNHRKKGLARLIMKSCINSLKGKTETIEISAQSYLSHFYTDLGFKSCGNYYLEDDIPHEKMVLNFI